MEKKFIVIKREDANKYLNVKGQEALNGILETIADARSMDNKKCDNKYLVVNKDEPYADLVENLILDKVSVDDIQEEIKDKILKEYAEDLYSEFMQVQRFEDKITTQDVLDLLQIKEQ